MEQNNNTTNSAGAKASKRYPISIRDNIFEQLYLNPEMSDVQFVFPSKGDQSESDKQRAKRAKKSTVSIPAHKLILKAGSKVFREMFNDSWKEKKEVEIVDATPEGFKEFLQCFYLGSGQFSKENIDQVMYLVEKYMIDDCLMACSSFLIDAMTLDDVCSGYALAMLYKQPNLKEFCERKIHINAKAVMDSSDFLHCNRYTLAEILKLDLICRETTVFDACIKWAKNACKRNGLDESNTNDLRVQLGECLYLIPFSNMTLEELCHCTSKYGDLLRGGEYLDVMNCIGLKGHKSKKFIQKPPSCWDESKIWQCKPHHAGSARILHTTGSVQITSSKSTLLGALHGRALFNCSSGQFFSTFASIEIIEKFSESDKVIFTGTMHFNGLDGAPLKFAEPIVIKEGVKYEICFGFKEHIGVEVQSMCEWGVESPKGLQINFDSKGNFNPISSLDLLDT